MSARSSSGPARLRLALAGLFATSLATAVGCGGSNSETPWPVEPEDVDLGPEGELRTNRDLAPSGTAKKAPASKPAPAAGQGAGDAEPEPPTTPRAPEPSTPSNPSTQF